MKTPTAAALLLAIDAAASVYRSGRNNALLAVHAQMMAASLPKSSPLWARLDDAYATIDA